MSEKLRLEFEHSMAHVYETKKSISFEKQTICNGMHLLDQDYFPATMNKLSKARDKVNIFSG